MKRCALGFWILLVLAALGLLAAWGMNRCHEPISRDLDAAAEHALAEDWNSALELSSQAQKAWEACRTLTAALSNHAPMENMDNLFARLKIYGDARDPVRFAETCAQLSQSARAIGEAQSWNLRNLL